MYVGGGLALGYHHESLSLPLFRGDTLCGAFTTGSSFLPAGYLLFETPLGEPASSLWVSPRLRFSSIGATMTLPGLDNVQARNPDSELVSVAHQYQLDATILALSADLFVKYPIASNFFAVAGPSISYLLKRTATLNDVSTTPGWVLPNGQTSQPVTNSDVIASNGQIANSSSIMAAFTLGASLDVPLSKKVMLAPELLCSIPITSILTDYNWHILTVSLGVALKFNIAPEPKLEVVETPTPPVAAPPPPKSEMSATVQISGVTKDSLGNEIETPDPQIRIEEFERREAYPALNYIFFGDDSAEIPSRYHRYASRADAQSFHADSLAGRSSLEVYHEELNVLGKRLADSASIRITLTGTNSGTGKEVLDTSIARKRAEAVKAYLVNVWQIDPSRISVATEGLPANPSSTTTPDGSQENRRVEIATNYAPLLDPLIVETIDRTMNPPTIRLRTKESSSLALVENTLYLRQADRILASYRGPGPMQQWHPTPDELPRIDSPLVATIHLTDSMGTEFQAEDTANVSLLTIRKKREERVKDKILEHYNLITFNFDKSDLSDRSKRVISEIAKSITPNTTVLIQGYTDITGESAHNLQLSEARAAAVEAALKEAVGKNGAFVTFQSEGEGQANLVDNRLPEGRFLSRTVFVELQKPVQ
jgi:outer membrane protein OmpA-like peptidoglycan-associated protein